MVYNYRVRGRGGLGNSRTSRPPYIPVKLPSPTGLTALPQLHIIAGSFATVLSTERLSSWALIDTDWRHHDEAVLTCAWVEVGYIREPLYDRSVSWTDFLLILYYHTERSQEKPRGEFSSPQHGSGAPVSTIGHLRLLHTDAFPLQVYHNADNTSTGIELWRGISIDSILVSRIFLTHTSHQASTYYLIPARAFRWTGHPACQEISIIGLPLPLLDPGHDYYEHMVSRDCIPVAETPFSLKL